MSRSIAPLLLAIGATLVAPPVRAQSGAKPDPPSPTERLVLRLDYKGVPGCSDSETFQTSLINKISGWNPIDDKGRWRLVVSVKRRGAGFDGSAQVYDPQDALVWSTLMPPPPPPPKPPLSPLSCDTLIDSLAVVLAIWMFPPEGFPTPPTRAPVCAPAPTAPAPTCPASTEAPAVAVTEVAPVALPVQLRTVPFVGIGARADFGAGWGAIFGATLEGGFQRREWRWGGWSLRGRLWWAPQQIGIGPPTTTTILPADVRTSLMAGSLAGCIYRAWPISLAGCIVGELGEVQASAGTGPINAHQAALFAGGGVGGRVEIPLLAHLYIQIGTEVVGIGKIAGNTGAWVNVPAQHFGGAAGEIEAGLGASF